MTAFDMKALKAAVAAQQHDPAQNSSPPDDHGFRVLTCDEMDQMPPPSWLIDGLIGEGHISCIYGESAALKSFIAIDIAMSIASADINWQGRETSHGLVVYVAAEGAPGLGKRCHAWRQHHGKLHQADGFRLIPHSVNVLDADEMNRLIATLHQIERDTGMRVPLTVLDTLAKSAPGADEDKARDMGLIIQATERIRDAIGCCVLLIHHTGKDVSRGARGSYSLKCGIDSEFEVTRKPNLLAVSIKIEKQKDDEDGTIIELGARQVEWERPGKGRMSSLVITNDVAPDPTVLADRRKIAAAMAPGQAVSVSKLIRPLGLSRGENSYRRIMRAIPSEPEYAVVMTARGTHKLWRGADDAEKIVYCSEAGAGD